MMAHEAHPADIRPSGPPARPARTLATLLGAAALVVGAFQHWTTAPRTGDTLTLRALVQTDFATRTDILKTVGGLSVLIGLVALAGLADRTGWLERLAGSAAVAVFLMFAIELFRSAGDSASAALRAAGAGVWMELGGGLLLMLGSLFGVHRTRRAKSHRRTGTAVPRRIRARSAAGAAPDEENATTVNQPVSEPVGQSEMTYPEPAAYPEPEAYPEPVSAATRARVPEDIND
jgi:hypothetical protein